MTTLLPSFNGNETWKKSKIQTNLDCRLTGVKRLATPDPNFFLFQIPTCVKNEVTLIYENSHLDVKVLT